MQLRSIRIGAMGVMAAAAVTAGVIVYDRNRAQTASDVIVVRSDRIAGEPWLKANLRNARVVQPDRPHSFHEVHAWRQGTGATIGRTRSYQLSTNSIGLRGPEIEPKAADVVRIIAIGDSVTHGWGVSREDSYPARLEALLTDQGHAVEVINAGVPANPVSVMALWCTRIAPELDPDIILWTRRPGSLGPGPTLPTGQVPHAYREYRDAVVRCKTATGARTIAVLPPISTFDLNGSKAWRTEYDHLRRRLAAEGIPVIELTEVFRKAQAGRGEVLVKRGDMLAVVDQESGSTWLEIAPSTHDLPTEIYTLFEAQPAVREALFFDDGHPDAEGFRLFAHTVASALGPDLRASGPAPTEPTPPATPPAVDVPPQ